MISLQTDVDTMTMLRKGAVAIRINRPESAMYASAADVGPQTILLRTQERFLKQPPPTRVFEGFNLDHIRITRMLTTCMIIKKY